MFSFLSRDSFEPLYFFQNTNQRRRQQLLLRLLQSLSSEYFFAQPLPLYTDGTDFTGRIKQIMENPHGFIETVSHLCNVMISVGTTKLLYVTSQD